MPKCFDYKTESPNLYSIDRLNPETPGMGNALCKECANKELKKQGRPLIK